MKKKHLRTGERELWLFLLPSLVGFALFYILPFALSVQYAVTQSAADASFVGFANLIATAQSPSFQTALLNTGRFMAVCIPLSFVLPFMLASFLQTLPRAKGAFMLLIMLPLAIPSGAITNFWDILFGRYGVLNKALYAAGSQPVFWLDSGLSFGVSVFMYLWKNMGYNVVLFAVALSDIPGEYFEVARLDGAGSWARFRYITLPCILPMGFFIFMLSFINGFRAFKEVYLLMGRYPHEGVYMLQHYMHNQFGAMNMQTLSASAYLFTAGIAIVVLVLFHAQRVAARDFE